MNLLFITYPNSPEPWVGAYDIDHPEPEVRYWRADRNGVRYDVGLREGSRTSGLGGVWHYLAAGTWQKLSQDEAFARFPELKVAIENWVEPW